MLTWGNYDIGINLVPVHSLSCVQSSYPIICNKTSLGVHMQIHLHFRLVSECYTDHNIPHEISL